jgi:hypothetical protein
VNHRELIQAAQAICRIPAYCQTKEEELNVVFEEVFVDPADPAAVVQTRRHQPNLPCL